HGFQDIVTGGYDLRLIERQEKALMFPSQTLEIQGVWLTIEMDPCSRLLIFRRGKPTQFIVGDGDDPRFIEKGHLRSAQGLYAGGERVVEKGDSHDIADLLLP